MDADQNRDRATSIIIEGRGFRVHGLKKSYRKKNAERQAEVELDLPFHIFGSRIGVLLPRLFHIYERTRAHGIPRG